MSFFNRRLASKEEYFQLFLVCALPVHLWAIFTLMKAASALISRLSASQVLGVVAYMLFFAFLESLFVFGILFVLSLILPPGFFRSRLVPVGTIIILLASVSTAFIHFYKAWHIQTLQFYQWTGLWVTFGLFASVLSIYWVRRNQKVETAIQAVVERLSMLSLVYLLFDFLGVFVVLFRNLF